MREQPSFLRSFLIAFGASCIPIFLLAWFIARFHTNVPYDGDWIIVEIIASVRSHQATWQDFWRFEGDHRILFPKLIWSGIALATHFDISWMLTINFVSAILTYAVILRISFKQNKSYTDRLSLLTLASTSLLLFSWTQYESWLNMQEFPAMAAQLCFISAVLILTIPWTERCKFMGAALACGISSFTRANGLLTWIALIPMIAHLASGVRRNKYLLVWLSISVLTFLVYWRHYTPNPSSLSSSMLDPLRRPGVAILFFFTLLGAPFLQGFETHSIFPLIGSIVLISFLVCWHFIRREKASVQCLPWITIGLFSVLSAIAVTMGRAFAVSIARDTSRYIEMVIFVPIAVIHMAHALSRLRPRFTPLLVLQGGAVVISSILTAGYALSQAREIHESRENARLCMSILPYIDPATDNFKSSCLFPLVTNERWDFEVRRLAKALNDMGAARFIQEAVFRDAPNEWTGNLKTARGGVSDRFIHISGWIKAPPAHPESVLLLISSGQKRLFLGETRIVFQTDRSENPVKWAVRIPLSVISTETSDLEAWVYEPDKKKFSRLASLR